jgi:putative flippase GtrA
MVDVSSSEQCSRSRAERFGDAMVSWVDRLPGPVRRRLPKSLVGFCILSGFTFTIDLILLVLLRRGTHMPIVLAVTLSYAIAFGLNFLLNRTVNFQSHAPVGPQVTRFAIVAICDYGLTVGLTSWFTYLGLDFRVARVTAAGCVGIFTYSMSRWWVFRDSPASQRMGESSMLV